MRRQPRNATRPRTRASIALALALWPVALPAQGPVLLEAAAVRRERASEPLFGGASLTSYRGPVGLRLGGAVHLRRGARDVPDARDVTDWTADADIVVEPFRPVGLAKSLLLGFSPYGFVGLGARGWTYRDAADTVRATASAGAGVHHQLLGPLVVGAEARYRRALRSDSAITLGSPRHWEYRIALGLSFGGGRRRMTSEGALARASIATACGGDCAPRAVERRVFAERTVSRVLDAADARVGRRYDATDFVADVFHAEGVRLPTSLGRLMDAGAPVPTSVGSLRPGDLLFFAGDRSVPDHVAIYVGDDRVVHASGGSVRYDVLGEGARGRWLAEHLVFARRVVTGDERRLRGRVRP